MSKSIEITGFVHHNQPYGTDHIDGIWTKYDQSDIDQMLALQQACLDDTNDYYREQKAYRWNSEIQRMERRIASHMGTLVGTITKGSTTSRLFQHTSTKDNAGNAISLENVTEAEIARGEKVSVAM